MTRPDRAAFSIAGLVISLLVFSWPQCSAWFAGASPSYPLVTVVFTALIIAIVATWPRGDRAPAHGRNAWTAGTVVVAAAAAVIVAVAAYRWIRILVWQPYQADMLIVIREATRRFLSGRSPYTTYRTYDAPWNMAMPYGPGLWGPFLVAQFFRLDFRFLTIAGELFVPVWCGAAAAIEWMRGRAAVAIAWLALTAALVTALDVQGFTLIGHTPVYWPLFPLFAIAIARSRWTLAACLLGLLVLARTTMVAIVPVFLLGAWIADRRRFYAAVGVLLATIGAGVLPFVVWDFHGVWDNMVLSYPRVMREAVWPVLARPGIETIGVTEWLIERHHEGLVTPVQLVAMLVAYVAAWQAMQRGAAALPWMALALFTFSMTTLYPVHYLYYDVLLLLVCSALAAIPGSDPGGVGGTEWLLSFSAVIVVIAIAATAQLSSWPLASSGDASSSAMMGSGFAMTEREGQRPFKWIVGHEATLVLPRRSAKAAAIVVTAESPFGPTEAPQTVTAILNGTVLGHTTVEAGWREIPFAAPRSTWWIGFNQLRLVFSSTVSPRAAGAGDDTRELALAVSSVAVTARTE
jgi:hypothetical protein